MNPPPVKQHDISDCAAACLTSIAAAFGLRLSLARVRQALGTNCMGTPASAVVRGAGQFGLSCKVIRAPWSALHQVPLPAIAHCRLKSGLLHYVVLCRTRRTGVVVMDPAVGTRERWSTEQFREVWTGVMILAAPSSDFRKGNLTIPAMQRLFHLLWFNRTTFAQVVLCSVLTTVLGFAMSLYVQAVVDRVLPNRDGHLLALISVGALLVFAVKTGIAVLHGVLALQMSQRIDASLVLAYYRHVLRLPQTYLDTMRVGELVSRVSDACRVRQFLNGAVVGLLLNPLIVLFSFAAMFLYSPPLALYSLALLPASAVLYCLADRLNRSQQRAVIEGAAEFDSRLVESITAQRTIRVYALEDDAVLQGESRFVALLRSVWRSGLTGVWTTNLTALLGTAYSVVLLWVGAGRVFVGQLTPGELMSCYTIGAYLLGPIAGIIGTNVSMREAGIAVNRLFEVLDLEVEGSAGAVELTGVVREGVRLEKVGFAYPSRRPVLDQISVEFRAGQFVVVAGESGSGKSTLLALIARLYSGYSGKILIDDMDTQMMSLACVRRRATLVQQHSEMLPGTVLSNLVLVDDAPDMRRLCAICQEIGALELIEALPQGFLTRIGDQSGTSLSGGQRQKLALARALYANAPILLLDEPTSALDAESEERVIRSLRRRSAEGKVVVVCTHSEAMIRAADRVVCLKQGSVIETCRDEFELQSANQLAQSA